MTIALITKEQHQSILDIQKNYPKLTYQNRGYDTLNKSLLSSEDNEKFIEVQEILKASIKGFSEFNNFKITKDNRICVRFQYDYSADVIPRSNSFTGVGYLLVDELLNGFEE